MAIQPSCPGGDAQAQNDQNADRTFTEPHEDNISTTSYNYNMIHYHARRKQLP